MRNYWQDRQYDLSIEEVIQIALVVATNHSELSDWVEFVGEWFTELAFDELEGQDGAVLRSRLRALCHSVPELWITCGRADAALSAYNMSIASN